MKMSLLDTLTVVSLRVGQAKQALLEKGTKDGSADSPKQRRREQLGILLLVPESKSNVLEAMCIANTGNAIFTPSVCAGPSVVVRKVYGATM